MKIKLMFSITIFLIVLVIFFPKVYASDIDDIFKGADKFIKDGVGSDHFIGQDSIKETSNSVYNILLLIGICIAVITSGVLGIRFMIGSMEEKAQVKEALIPFVIGCIVVFGSFTIWKIIVTIGNKI